jgi:23S rRNA pseudouridine1911/1915/1917 synthase
MSSSFTIRHEQNGETLATVVRAALKLTWSQVQRLIEARRVRVNNTIQTNIAWRVRTGQRIDIDSKGHSQPPQKRTIPAKKKVALTSPVEQSSIEIVYSDEQIVVVDKPSGITTMRHPEEAAEFGKGKQRFLPATLADLLPGMLGQPNRPVRPVHRIDRDTSGLVVFARTSAAETHLGKQFRDHSTRRLYLALVRGKATSARIESFLVRDRGDGRRGSSTNSTSDENGQRAITHVKVVEEFASCTLIECRLETGRTHQIRIHLGEQGTPLCGERIYDRPLSGVPVPDSSGASRPLLHATTLGLIHPSTNDELEWTSPLPDDIHQILSRLRKTCEE